MALSDSAIRKAKPADKPIRLFDGGGLYLEISPSGSKLWRLKYRFASKEKRLAFRNLADSCLLLVDRQLQFAHDRAQLSQGFFRLALPTQDHEIVGVGHEARTKALLQPELLPPQHEPAHVQIRQQR